MAECPLNKCNLKEIIRSGRADGLLYVYRELELLKADFEEDAKNLANNHQLDLFHLDEIVCVEEELAAMVAVELDIDKSNFFASMLVKDILLEVKKNYRLRPYELSPSTERTKLLDITGEELRQYVLAWCEELNERKDYD